MMKYTLGFIGVGNMGSALLYAALRTVDADKIAICDNDTEKTESLALSYGVAVATAEEIAGNADFVILGVKPYGVSGVIERIASHLHDGATLVSMAAGVSLGKLSRYLEDDEIDMITRLYVKEQDEYEIALAKKTSVSDIHFEKMRILDKIKKYYNIKKVV